MAEASYLPTSHYNRHGGSWNGSKGRLLLAFKFVIVVLLFSICIMNLASKSFSLQHKKFSLVRREKTVKKKNKKTVLLAFYI